MQISNHTVAKSSAMSISEVIYKYVKSFATTSSTVVSKIIRRTHVLTENM
jgi:hypothetical protein